MIDLKAYPRLSGTLRAHSNIAERLNYRGGIDELQRRRQQSSDTDSKKVYAWTELQQLFIKHGSSAAAIEPMLKQLRKYAIEFGQFHSSWSLRSQENVRFVFSLI